LLVYFFFQLPDSAEVHIYYLGEPLAALVVAAFDNGVALLQLSHLAIQKPPPGSRGKI
jgi:hypothetical protein